MIRCIYSPHFHLMDRRGDSEIASPCEEPLLLPQHSPCGIKPIRKSASAVATCLGMIRKTSQSSHYAIPTRPTNKRRQILPSEIFGVISNLCCPQTVEAVASISLIDFPITKLHQPSSISKGDRVGWARTYPSRSRTHFAGGVMGDEVRIKPESLAAEFDN